MLEILIAQGLAAYPATECPVALEQRTEERLVLRLRPACPIGYPSTHGAVRAALAYSDAAAEVTVAFGRLADYPWLSNLLSRRASSSRVWDLQAGRAQGESDNSYVANSLRHMPEFTALFDRWRVLGVSVEKVLVKPAAQITLAQGAPVAADALLPWDAIVWVRLARP